jgi:vacuolar protein sorting-associated protein 13A/C
MSDMIRHYSSQAIKQAYVVIFGLDVIGNPFGLVVGVSRSIEDFFYEPFQVKSNYYYLRSPTDM